MSSFDSLATELEQRQAAGLYRSRLVVDGPQGAELCIDGNTCLNFCSNDYLGMANHPEVLAAFHSAADQYGVGSGASHLVNGHSRVHHQLEEALAEFTGRDRALLFSTGYMANLGAVSALLGRNDAVFEDRLNHASLLDAGWLSKARFTRYRHADPADLVSQLEKSDARRNLVVTDGVFSMDGDVAPLPELVAATEAAGAWLMVDDAHGLGCVGATGRGSIEYLGLEQDRVPILVGTLGKAFGTAGAFVAGSEALIETLIQHARTYIYTTAIPPAVAGATLASLRLIESEQWRRERLAELISQFRTGAMQLGYELADSETPIQPIMVGEARQALALSDGLREQGILVTAIRPPTVPQGSARLRVTLSAAHTPEQVSLLLAALARVRDCQEGVQ